jgi:hypothetical protein
MGVIATVSILAGAAVMRQVSAGYPVRCAQVALCSGRGDRRRETWRPRAVLRTSVATLTFLMLVPPTAAQPLRPAVKQVQCPVGYMQSGGYCMPMGRNPPSAIPKRPPVGSPPLNRFLLPRGT